jgi:5'-3' exonuclease
MANFILIDGSYFCFFRYYAMIQWWGLSKQDEPLGIPIQNKEFVDKFISTFKDKVRDIKKKLNIANPVVIVGKDCPRHMIWRNKLFDSYKSNRINSSEFLGKPFFKMAYDTLWEDAGVNAVVGLDLLEADDCIALTVERILESVEDPHIWIIASDMDYLQIVSSRVSLYNLKYQDVSKSKSSCGDPEIDKFCKIVCGDKSDAIPGVFRKCGPKTALKLYHSKTLFEDKLKSEEGSEERYNRNTQLIDFKMIPPELRIRFRRDVLKCI